MFETESIHSLLDRYLAALRALGPIPVRDSGSAPSVDQIRHKLVEAGFHDRDDVVEFLTWMGRHHVDNGFQLFWETGSPFEVDAAMKELRLNREIAAEVRIETGDSAQLSPDEQQRRFPGPTDWLPVLFLDGTEFLSVDCRPDPVGGSVWFLFIESENRRLFDSLAEGIEAAIYCVEAGLWGLSDYGVSCDERPSMPGQSDRDNPPWAR